MFIKVYQSEWKKYKALSTWQCNAVLTELNMELLFLLLSIKHAWKLQRPGQTGGWEHSSNFHVIKDVENKDEIFLITNCYFPVNSFIPMEYYDFKMDK